ncbi:hypothetical protein G7Y79_00046g082700 [Physcia stellaris]|nr:hypothetical protein G7Y79_00046g082700 [Physcia stellaris]
MPSDRGPVFEALLYAIDLIIPQSASRDSPWHIFFDIAARDHTYNTMQYLKTLYLPALALLAITACALPVEPSEAITAPDLNATAVPATTEHSAGRDRGGWPWIWSRALNPGQDDDVATSEDEKKAIWSRLMPPLWCFRHVCSVKARDQMQRRADLTGWSFAHGRSHPVTTDASEE